MEPRTFDEYLDACIELRKAGEHSRWLLGDLLIEAKKIYTERGFTRIVASYLGYTERYVSEIIKVSNTFAEDERVLELSWEIHRICARTKDPHGWLDRAVNEQLSARQLREAILAEKDTGDEEEKAMRAGERLLRSMKEYIEKYGHIEAVDEILGEMQNILHKKITDEP